MHPFVNSYCIYYEGHSHGMKNGFFEHEVGTKLEDILAYYDDAIIKNFWNGQNLDV